MKTIVEPKESIDKLWGKQKVREGETYRLMRYVLRVEHEDKVLLHNAVTGQLALLTEEEADLLPHLPAKPTEPMRELIANHFLVPQDYDEYRSTNQLRLILQRRSTGEAINHYVILPTTFCNAHCFYCYESDYPRVHMTEETGRKVIDYILEHRQDKTVRLSWFGGEPLLGISRIDQITTGLKEHGVPFTSDMISNGYLFDEEVVEKCVNLWNLNHVQITLDGTEPVYNRVKAYANAEDNPFQRVLRNIDLLSKREVPVTIRLNLDYYNKQDIRTLMEELAKRYSGNQHVKVYASLLYNDEGYEPVHYSENEYLELVRIHDEYTKLLIQLNLSLERRQIPVLQIHQCMADNPHSIVIQPDGGFCRCEHECVNDSYGSVQEGVLDPQKPLQWMESMTRTDDCPECCTYPFCYMLRNCMGTNLFCNEGIRSIFQKQSVDRLRSVYHMKLEDEKDERI